MAKDNQQPLTGCGDGDIAPYVFLCGDPARVPKVSACFDDFQEVCRVREYLIHTGTRSGVPLTVASTGIGGPSTAIVVEELAKLGAHTLIRIGNSGAIADRVELGDYVITTGSIRDEGTTRSYVRPDFPAVAHWQVTAALAAAAQASGRRWHAGITWSVDGFYSVNKMLGTEGDLQTMSAHGYEQAGMNERLRDARRSGVVNIEMESSTVLTLASLFGLRGGCICTVSDRAPWPGPGQDMISLDRNIAGAIDVALAAMQALAAADAKAGA